MAEANKKKKLKNCLNSPEIQPPPQTSLHRYRIKKLKVFLRIDSNTSGVVDETAVVFKMAEGVLPSRLE